MLSIDANLKMEVGAGGPAGGANLSQRLAPGDFLANGDQDGAVVAIQGGDSAPVVHDNIFPVAAARGIGVLDDSYRTICHRYRLFAVDAGARDVDAGVEVGVVEA